MSLSTEINSSYQYTPAVQSVTELTRSLKVIVENGFSFISVCGEVSNQQRPYSGHLYFTLKDSTSQIKAVLFKQQQRYLRRDFSNGDKVICRGRISIYEPRGEYQIIVDAVEFSGEGDLQLAFEQCKKRLAAEGLFDIEHKKSIPLFPRSIALITSPTGAAVHDFLSIALSRFPAIPVEIYPVRVQGSEAAKEICAALSEANEQATADVIVICRGGGSIEDLWPFNDEALARSVHQSKLPVVSAVGHEVDFTILDFVADCRAATPTAAAEIVVPSRRELTSTLARLSERMATTLARRLTIYRETVLLQGRLLKDPSSLLHNTRLRIDQLQTALVHTFVHSHTLQRQNLKEICSTLANYSPQRTIGEKNSQIASLKQSLSTHLQQTLTTRQAQLRSTVAILEALNPKAVLKRGYSIVYSVPAQTIIHSSAQVSPGDRLHIVAATGAIDSTVTGTT